MSLLLIRTCLNFTLNSNEQASVVISQNQHGNMKNASEKKWRVALPKIVKQNGCKAHLEAIRDLKAILTLDSQTHERRNESNWMKKWQ